MRELVAQLQNVSVALRNQPHAKVRVLPPLTILALGCYNRPNLAVQVSGHGHVLGGPRHAIPES